MINVKEIGDFVAANNGITKTAAVECVKDTFRFIKDELAAGNEVNIDKFGKFVITTRAARVGHNPATGAAVNIPAKDVVKFKAAKSLKDEVK